MLSLLSSLEEGEDDDDDDFKQASMVGFALCYATTSIHKAGDYFNMGGNTLVEMMIRLKMMFEDGSTSFEDPVSHHSMDVSLPLIQIISCSGLEEDGKLIFRVSLFQRLGDFFSVMMVIQAIMVKKRTQDKESFLEEAFFFKLHGVECLTHSLIFQKEKTKGHQSSILSIVEKVVLQPENTRLHSKDYNILEMKKFFETENYNSWSEEQPHWRVQSAVEYVGADVLARSKFLDNFACSKLRSMIACSKFFKAFGDVLLESFHETLRSKLFFLPRLKLDDTEQINGHDPAVCACSMDGPAVHSEGADVCVLDTQPPHQGPSALFLSKATVHVIAMERYFCPFMVIIRFKEKPPGNYALSPEVHASNEMTEARRKQEGYFLFWQDKIHVRHFYPTDYACYGKNLAVHAKESDLEVQGTFHVHQGKAEWHPKARKFESSKERHFCLFPWFVFTMGVVNGHGPEDNWCVMKGPVVHAKLSDFGARDMLHVFHGRNLQTVYPTDINATPIQCPFLDMGLLQKALSTDSRYCRKYLSHTRTHVTQTGLKKWLLVPSIAMSTQGPLVHVFSSRGRPFRPTVMGFQAHGLYYSKAIPNALVKLFVSLWRSYLIRWSFSLDFVIH